MRSWVRVLVLGLILLLAAGPPTFAQVGTLSGAPSVSTESTIPTYRCAGETTPAAAPQDVIVLTGSATKTLHITQIRVSIESTTAGIADLRILRRSTADSGGTSSAPAITKLDTTNAAATAVCTLYTVNPAGNGNLVSVVDSARTSGTSGVPMLFTFGQNTQSLIARGTSDFIAINGNANTLLTGEQWSFMIEWSEQ